MMVRYVYHLIVRAAASWSGPSSGGLDHWGKQRWVTKYMACIPNVLWGKYQPLKGA